MITIDVRLRAGLLTLVLVVILASVVQFWPEATTTSKDISAELMDRAGTQNDSPLKRHFDWAVTQLRSGHFQLAIDGFRAVLEQAPAMPEAYTNIGFAQLELEQYAQAQASFQTAIDLRPGQVNAYWGLAVSLEGLCDIPAAIGAMRTYLHLAPPDDQFRVKASAALWEWEQLRTTGGNEQGMPDCSPSATS